MKIICINSEGVEDLLTVGSHYYLVNQNDKYHYISRDDLGSTDIKSNGFYSYRFKSIVDVREEKLKMLLNS